MLADTTQDLIVRWVAQRLERSPDETRRPGVWVAAHGPALADYHGVYVWLMEQTALVSAPAGLVAAIRHTVAGQSPAALADPTFWRAALGEQVERIIGPSYQGFLDAGALRPLSHEAMQGARPLTHADAPALAHFVAACPPDDWADGAIAVDHLPIYGVERDGALIALASAPADGMLRSVGVVTLPAWRGTGAGRAVVGALTARCVEEGASLRYQTLRANVASVAIARTLGYVDVATALGVRLRRAQDELK